jgi:hypothetical protein
MLKMTERIYILKISIKANGQKVGFANILEGVR